MNQTEQLEQYWNNLILSFPYAEKTAHATIITYPQFPLYAVNHATDLKINEKEHTILTRQIEEYFNSKKVPYTCFRISPLTQPKEFSNFLTRNQYELKSEQSVMILNRKDTSKKPAAKITIKPLSCSNDVPVFCSLMAKIFQIPPEYEQGLKEFTFDSIQAGWKFYLEYINKTPVGTGALFSANKVGGVFNVGTLSEYRKQGIGTALMQQIICDSIDSGNLIHTLQAETGKDAERLYKKMGFTIDHHIQFFAKENKS